MPVFQFSYFDPEEGKYVSLKSEAAPLMVTGEVPAPVAPAAPLVAEKATPTPAPAKAADIVGIKYELGKVERSFAPLYRSRQFWLAQGLPLLGLLALLGWHFSRKGEGERGIAALRKERGELWRTLRQGASHEAFYHAAARVLQIDTALALGLPILSVDPAAVKRTLGSDPQTSQGIDEIFAAHAELHYAGAGHSDGAVSAPERDRVLATLERAQKNHG